MKKFTSLLQISMVLALICSGFCACQNIFKEKLLINIQPFDKINNLDESINQFDEYLKNIGLQNYEIRVCSIVEAPKNAYVYHYYEDLCWYRLRADSLLKILDKKDKKNEFTIGITPDDISCTVHGVDDFGVLGLASPSKTYNACVISTLRLEDKKNLWKLMAHEFTHGYFSQGHCKADDPHCIMQDAKKKPNFAIKDSLCSECRKEIASKL